LLNYAKIDLEEDKYTYTENLSALKEWNGITVISEFSNGEGEDLIEQIERISEEHSGFSISLNIKKEISKTEIYGLLDNNNFTTYLKSPFNLAESSVISPSILFVLAAEKLTINEFRQAISSYSFTVNEVAVAINNNMSSDYLNALIQNTKDIKSAPIYVIEQSYVFMNLADLAIKKYDVDLLRVLDSYGVIPTNEEGIITGMDIAISNLPRTLQEYQNIESSPKKYINTLKYLKNKGYKAHGATNINSTDMDILFEIPFSSSRHSDSILDSELKKLIQQVDLIDKKYHVKQVEPDDSIIYRAILSNKVRQDNVSIDSRSCKVIKEKLLLLEHFSDKKSTLKLIREIEKKYKEKGNVIAQLHEVDPVLVNIWYRLKSFDNLKSDTNSLKGEFITYIKENRYQAALDYSSSSSLDQKETDFLLASLLNNPEKLMPIWNARVLPKKPSNLMMFKYLPINKWEHLLDEGFDFTIRDIWGNDLLITVLVSSPMSFNFLIEVGLSTDMKKPGLDIFDLALEIVTIMENLMKIFMEY
jgi:hypothetical protein